MNHKSTLENISLSSGKGTWNSGILLQDAIKEWHKRYSENDSLSQGLIGNVSTDEKGNQPKRMVTKRFATKLKESYTTWQQVQAREIGYKLSKKKQEKELNKSLMSISQ